jgi:RNA 2',3'-cyclic 3'-phosphodiesterase
MHLYKTHQSAVVAMPSRAIWEPIQAIRRQHDRQLHRWMPHINLLYPFYPRDQLQPQQVIPRLAAACRQVPAFEVTLATLRYFTHGVQRATIWLAPEPREAFVHLQATLQQAFPDYDEQSRFSGGFTPHLSVGQVTSRRALQSLLVALQSTWVPLKFHLDAVGLICRTVHGPFQVEHAIPLANGGADDDLV